MRDRLPLVLSTTALIVALFGSTPLGQAAYNAVVPKNSVGAQQLRSGAVTNAKLRGDAVTSGKVKNGSLLSSDFKAGQLPTGPSGPQGTKGDKGDTGAPGLSGYEIVRASTVVPANGISEAQAACPSGKKVIGGAGSAQGLPPGVFIHTQVVEPNIYGTYAMNTTAVSQQVNATAICATVAP